MVSLTGKLRTQHTAKAYNYTHVSAHTLHVHLLCVIHIFILHICASKRNEALASE